MTVHYGLNPCLVLSHFLLSIVVLTLGVLLALETRTARPTAAARVGAARRRCSSALAALVLIVSGTLTTASGRIPGARSSADLVVPPAVYWHVRATAVFGISFALLLVWLVRTGRQVRGGLVLLGLLAVQMTIGEVQYRTHFPWWLVLVHVTMAATLWAAVRVRLQPVAPA